MSSDGQARNGLLVAVIGPSGAGKDTLLDGAKRELADDPRFVFARRVVTRPARAGDEDHDTLEPDAFERAEASGLFALTWRAHGLSYGLPVDLVAERRRGRVVVANLSRRTLAQAATVFGQLAIAEITAPPAVLAQRIAGRGREAPAAIEARLARDPGTHAPPGTLAHERISNAGEAAAGIAALVAFLRRHADAEAETAIRLVDAGRAGS